ncbi:MAG: hypothetical protein LV479_03405 [Methylacidiphilales bacterium]|nr:hypothetical protein [Candidatus Methylacidiphilales bacterium]
MNIAVVPLAGALLGFLRYNFNPATIFLGDSGSLFIGFLLGCYGLLWSEKSATMLGMTAPLMALAIPLLDTSIAIVRRFIHRQPIFTADRGHIHHRLLDRGLTPRKVALLLYAFCALGAICSLVMIASTSASGIVLVVFCAVTWIGVQHLGYVEFGTAGRMFLDSAFRRQLSARIALDGLERNLVAATTSDECWSVIHSSSRELGFAHVEMSLWGRTFSSRNGAPAGSYYSVRIPISDDDCLHVARVFGENSRVSVIGPFADIVRRTLTPKREASGALAPLYQPRLAEPASRHCLFINQFFWPDSAATSQFLTDLVTRILREGHNARVICAANRYAGEESAPPPTLAIQRCPAVPFVTGIFGRLVSYVSFLTAASIFALRGERPQTIITLTTPPGLALIGSLIRSFRGARHFIWEMDVYPDIAFDLKVLPQSALLKRLLTWAFDLPRRRADGIIALGDDMKDQLIAHGICARQNPRVS